MIRIQLPTAEVEALERTLRTDDDPKLRIRVQIVLMAHRGRPRGQIARDTAHLEARSSAGSTPTRSGASTPSDPGGRASRGPSSPPTSHRPYGGGSSRGRRP